MGKNLGERERKGGGREDKQDRLNNVEEDNRVSGSSRLEKGKRRKGEGKSGGRRKSSRKASAKTDLGAITPGRSLLPIKEDS